MRLIWASDWKVCLIAFNQVIGLQGDVAAIVNSLHVWWQVNIGSGNGLVLLSNKPLTEQVLPNISVYGVTRLQWVQLSELFEHIYMRVFESSDIMQITKSVSGFNFRMFSPNAHYICLQMKSILVSISNLAPPHPLVWLPSVNCGSITVHFIKVVE